MQARTASQGANGVTGESEPKATVMPAASMEAKGFIGASPTTRSAPSRAA